jgi:hypothetical protein
VHTCRMRRLGFKLRHLDAISMGVMKHHACVRQAVVCSHCLSLQFPQEPCNISDAAATSLRSGAATNVVLAPGFGRRTELHPGAHAAAAPARSTLKSEARWLLTIVQTAKNTLQ